MRRTMIMKKILLPAVALVLGLASCNMLNTVPESTLAPENYFKTETDLQLFSNTFYNNLLEKEPYNEQSDFNTKNEISAVMKGGNQRSIPATGGGWSWTNLRKMNTLLAHMENCDDKAAVAKYTGVTKFFRAYFYFDKVQRFGDVPWIDRELASDDEQLLAPRDSRDVILEHMIEDIDEAIALLPDAVSMYRVNKWTALTLKAQFCLYEGTWRKYHANDVFAVQGKPASYFLELAADAAAQVIASGKYSLAPSYLKLFADPDGDKNEYILAIKNDFSLAIFNNSTGQALNTTQGCPGLTKKFVDTFLMKDGSRFTDKEGWETMQFVEQVADRDPRLSQIIRTPGYKRIGGTDLLVPDLSMSNTGYHQAKYLMDCTLEGVDRVTRSYNDMPVYRYAEVLLMYAEAKAELGTISQEDLDKSINVIRNRAGMPHLDRGVALDPYLVSDEYGYLNPILRSDPNVAIITEIRRERGVEMAWEARRLTDVMRWAEGKCLEQPIYGMYFPEPANNYDKDGKHYEYGEYDLDGDGVVDYCLWTGTKPKTTAKFVIEMGKTEGVVLTEGNHGYVIRQVVKDASAPHGFKEVARNFNESRDYLYPIPSQELILNNNLKQNPGWI